MSLSTLPPNPFGASIARRNGDPELIIGNCNYSTWSLRPWFLLQAFNVPFTTTRVSLLADGLRERLLRVSPAARVPVFRQGGLLIWDSLAICEYVSEIVLSGRGWPRDPIQRAQARSIVSEMHAGFAALRSEMPMNIRARRRIQPSAAAWADVRRICQIWNECRARAGDGRWLFSSFSIADCFFAPVVFRFRSYGIVLDGLAEEYAQSIENHPALQSWIQAALDEEEVLPEDEAGEPMATVALSGIETGEIDAEPFASESIQTQASETEKVSS